MIHVCFGIHDKTGHYSKFTGTAILSLFENTKSKVTVHILHDNTLTQDNRDKFSRLAERYNQLVKFYNVEELCAAKIVEYINIVPSIKNSRVSVGAFYRLLISQILSPDIEKIIYFDSDIIVNLDIVELWQFELGEKILGVVTISDIGGNLHCDKIYLEGYIKTEDYFNSGVLLMNLKLLRNEEETLLEGLRFRREHSSDFFDQPILNYCFSTRTLKLSARFNKFVWCARRENETFADKKIYHYTGGGRCQLDMRDPFNRLWMSYFIKTPWFDENSIGRLYEGVQRLHVELKAAMVQLSALMSGKARAFFALPQDIEMLKIFFAMRDDEEVILAETEQSLRELIDAMRRSRGKKVFFIMVANFPFNMLIQAGFVYGKDFLNGLEFLSEANGMPLNSYELIKAM